MEKERIDSLRKSVRVIPWWMRYFPGFTKMSGFALKNRFLLKPSLYNDLMLEEPNEYTLGIVLHEFEHMKRSQKIGYAKYRILYSINSKFRYNEELACHKPQFKYLKEKNFNFNLEKRAKILSSSLYLWPVSYKQALADLQNLWELS